MTECKKIDGQPKIFFKKQIFVILESYKRKNFAPAALQSTENTPKHNQYDYFSSNRREAAKKFTFGKKQKKHCEGVLPNDELQFAMNRGGASVMEKRVFFITSYKVFIKSSENFRTGYKIL